MDNQNREVGLGVNVYVQTGNDSMKTSKQVADALRKAAEWIEKDSLIEEVPSLTPDESILLSRPINDVNGNTVGDIKIIEG